MALRKENRTMINDYEVATILELGEAQEVVRGDKEIAEEVESLTLEFGLRWIPATDD